MSPRRPRLYASPWAWCVLGAALTPVTGVFTTRSIFFVRDLSFFFWSRHLWLRHTIFSGQAPWWDPYVAGGQSAIADALNQLTMPLTLAVRLLPSDVVSFNLWVVLPLAVAALGTFVFLRSRLSDAAAAFGACVFALSGPVVSMLNTPNLAWSVALIPWVLAACETQGTRREARIAVAFGLQALCGEPVTWIATGCLALLWILTRRRGWRGALAQVLGLALGGLLASVQLLPTAMASVRAQRASLATPDFWSLHPLSLWETLAPHLFGNYYDAFLGDLPWMGALNFGRDPFFYSLYVGPLALLLACIGAARWRRNSFWAAVAAASVIAAFGGYTPIYPLLRRLVPALMYFRFPVKHIVFAALAVAAMAADGWEALRTRAPDDPPWPVWLAALVGSVTVAVTVALILSPVARHDFAYTLAVETHLEDPAAGAEVLARIAPPLALRAGGMLMAAALLLTLAPRRRHALWLLAGAACVDLLITNGGLNQTIEVAKLAPPAWFTRAAGESRLYIGGRVRGYMNADDPDAARTWRIPAESTAIAGRMELNAELPMAPSGWRVREALSYDLPYLWPAEYEAVVRRFEAATPQEREAFLRRSGVRWCVVSVAQPHPWRVAGEVPDWNMRVYECNPAASRLAFASDAGTMQALFDPARPDDEPAGQARIVEDRNNEVRITATASRATLLVLRDSYDPSWRAEVDGRPVPILRANGVQRAVALAAGTHVVRFSYRPREFLGGLILSVMAIVLIGISGFRGFRGLPPDREHPDRARILPHAAGGFTLIELMIVLAIIAILLSLAFAEYRGLKAKGNEASALSSMRSIAAAQWQFALTCGHMKYATSLPALGQPVPTTGEAFLSPDLALAETIEKSGYLLHVRAAPLNDAPPACNGAPVADGYAATADPIEPGVTGRYYYGVNAGRVLYLDEQKSFKDDLPETGDAPHGQEVK